MIVATVLRSGGIYTREWVYALKRGLVRQESRHPFRVLTDVPGIPPMWPVPLEHDWPGWWAKLELFRPGVFPEGELVLYVDLDTLIVGDLTDIAAYEGPFAMLADFGRPALRQSGVMAWTPGPVSAAIWDLWRRDPERHMQRYRGDGEFLHAATEQMHVDVLQELYPGQIVSWKRHARQGCPSGARIVCGHGNPRFNDPRTEWAHEAWART